MPYFYLWLTFALVAIYPTFALVAIYPNFALVAIYPTFAPVAIYPNFALVATYPAFALVANSPTKSPRTLGRMCSPGGGRPRASKSQHVVRGGQPIIQLTNYPTDPL